MSAAVCTIIISPRDRFSTLEKCVTNVLRQTAGPVDVVLVSGGTPERVRQRLEKNFSSQVNMIFREQFLTGPEARNIGLMEAKTELAACLDSDVFVRPGWLEPLLDCYRDTGAAMIAPIVLDRQSLIHTAGNRLYVTQSRGKKYGMAELHYANLPWAGASNIGRFEMDYAEVHCQLVHAEKALRLGIYDEHFREGSDFDSGMTLKQHGEKIIQEGASQVYLYYPPVLNDLIDRDLYLWKWDLETTLENFRYFESKWGIDMISMSNMRNHIIMLNHRVGLCTRLFPGAVSLGIDKAFFKAKSNFLGFFGLWRKLKNKIIGFSAS